MRKRTASAISTWIAALLLFAAQSATASARVQAKLDARGSAAPSQDHRAEASTARNGAGSARSSASQRAANYFDSIKNDPSMLLAFLRAMPKGADLHNHLSGAVYAEDYIKMAIANQLCVNPNNLALTLPPCAPGQQIDQAMTLDSALYDKLIDAWSMRNWQHSGQSGHDHFFGAFGKFGAAINDKTTSEMLAAVLNQAAADHVDSVELMSTPNSTGIRKIAQGRWNDDFDTMARTMTEAGLPAEVKAGLDLVKNITLEARARMGCKSKAANPGCSVDVRFLFQGQRGSIREQAFALFLAGFQMVMHPENRDPWTGDPLVAGINLVQPEDSPVAIEDFSLQMSMLD